MNQICSDTESQTRSLVRHVLGTPLEVTTYAELSRRCQVFARRPCPTAIEFANTQVVTMRRHEPAFRASTQEFDYFVPDGMPLIWCMNWCGAKLEDRVYGPTFMRHLMQDTPAPFTHYLLGGSPESSGPLLNVIKDWNSQTRVVGVHHGVCRPDGELADPTVIDEINRLSPDFIWIALGTPKQQAWIHNHKARLRRGVILSVGFAFDANAGTKRDAPLWMQRRGLTWLFRMVTEPGRLGPRYLRYNSLFLFYLLWDGIRGRSFAGSPKTDAAEK
jgi:N-acetylglucosaminyldiphosphoundecaprenol N-acetyl-beta-D-mannosaminyltransferase